MISLKEISILILLLFACFCASADYKNAFEEYERLIEVDSIELALMLETEILNNLVPARNIELASFYHSSAKVHFGLRQYAVSTIRYEESIRLYNQLSQFDKMLEVSYDLGYSLMRIGQYEKSLDAFTTAYQVALSNKNKKFEFILLKGRAKAYHMLEADEDAERDFRKVLGNDYGKENTYEYARVLADFADYFYQKSELDSAIVYSKLAVGLLAEVEDLAGNQVLNYMTLANARHESGKTILAQESFGKAFEIARSSEDTTALVVALLGYAVAIVETGEYELVIATCDELMSLPQVSSIMHVRHEVLRVRAQAHRKLENFDKALNDYLAADSIEKQVRSSWSEVEFAEAEMMDDYDSELKVAEIKSLQLQAERDMALSATRTVERNWVIALCALLFVFALLLLRMNNQKSRLVEQERELFDKRLKEFAREKEILSLNSLIAGQEMERARLGKDLHDRVGGILSAVKLQFEVFSDETLNESQLQLQQARVMSMIDRAVEEVRMISHDLVQNEIEQLGISNAILKLCHSMNNGKVKIFSDIHVDRHADLPPLFADHIYRIVQELLTNSLRHSQANELELSLDVAKKQIELCVQDNGRGANLEEFKYGLGLQSMKERVAEMNGKVDFNTKPNLGFGVKIYIPLARKLEEVPA